MLDLRKYFKNIYWYNNKEEEALIIKEIKKRFTKGSIKDFILLIMNVPDTYNNLENAAVANTIKEYLGTTNFSPPLVPEYQYVIYFYTPINTLLFASLALIKDNLLNGLNNIKRIHLFFLFFPSYDVARGLCWSGMS